MFELPSDKEITRAVKTNDLDLLSDLCIPLAKLHENWKFVQEVCVELSGHENEGIRGSALMGLSMVSLFHNKLEKNIVKPVLLRGLKDDSEFVKRAANTAIQDINSRLQWKIGIAQTKKVKEKPSHHQNSSHISKIKFTLEGDLLQAFIAISYEFEDCGKLEEMLLSTSSPKKNFKLNDSDFLCVYKGMLKALAGERYPNKSGNEFNAVKELVNMFDNLHLIQRCSEIKI
jgi:hypothetical protein